jgi:hypothetical protein
MHLYYGDFVIFRFHGNIVDFSKSLGVRGVILYSFEIKRKYPVLSYNIKKGYHFP